MKTFLKHGILVAALGLVLAACSTPLPTPTPAAQSREVTLADKDATVEMKVGDRFLLNLGDFYDWSLNVADTSILDRVKNIAVIKGAQGVYEALKPGRTTLSATGDPACRKSTPPCAAPSILFEVTVVVK